MAKITKRPKKFIDSDHDGLSDWEEENIYGSDPNDADSNSDGISDGEAVRLGFHPVTNQRLKDFFVPNEENNFQPKVLHPKRVVFHIGAALLVKLLVIIFVLVYPLSVWMSPDVLSGRGQEIISLTNGLRQGLSLSRLEESDLLNQSAYKKVQDMFLNQYFAHTSPDLKGLKSFLKEAGYRYSTAGENLAIGFSSPREVMTAWENSPTHYNNLVDSDFLEIGVSLVENIFEEDSTVLIAQHFAAPAVAKVKQEIETPIQAEVQVQSYIEEQNNLPEIVEAEEIEEDTIESEEIIETEEVVEVVEIKEKEIELEIVEEKTANIVLSESIKNEDVVDSTESTIIETKVTIDHPQGKDETFVKVEAELKPEIVKATAIISNHKIELAKNSSGSWQANEIVFDKKDTPKTPATLVMIDDEGDEVTEELMTANIKPSKTSLSSQYMILRNNPNKAIQRVFDISSIYFKFILVIAVIASLLNFFIEIKKQHPKLIMSGIGFTVFMLILIVI